MAIAQNITVFRGETVTLTFTLTPTTDITGWGTRLVVVRPLGSTDLLLSLVGETTDAPGGVFSVVLDTTDTDIDPGVYAYAVWRTDEPRVLTTGTLTVRDVAPLP